RPSLGTLLPPSLRQPPLQRLRPRRSHLQYHQPWRRLLRQIHRPRQEDLPRFPHSDLRHPPSPCYRHPRRSFQRLLRRRLPILHPSPFVPVRLPPSRQVHDPPLVQELHRGRVEGARLWKRYNARGRFTMMPEVPFDQFRVGSQFFVLTRRHALMVVKDHRLWKKFRLPCYREDECYPEEHYSPTLLSMQDLKGVTQYTLTKVNWTGTVNGHPYTYRPSEISPALIQGLRESNYSNSYLFARKFTPDCLVPLLKIADRVIFRD
ncbi:Glycosyltransferase BC10, partial [Linum grandiflorum]